MEQEYTLYKFIIKNSNMAIYSLNKLVEELNDKDNKIIVTVLSVINGYNYYYDNAKKELENNNIKYKENKLTKIPVLMGIKKEVANDNSDSSIADMLIQGINMGILDMEKKISKYKDLVSKKEFKLAKKFLNYQNKVVDEYKKYL